MTRTFLSLLGGLTWPLATADSSLHSQQPPITGMTTTTGVVIDVTVADRDGRAVLDLRPVDAAGLRVHSEEAKVARKVEMAGAQGVGDAQRGDGAWTKDLERQEQLLSSRASAVLGRLAKETGGFLLDNTNDLGKGVARIYQERTTYYLLGYQPTNTAADGTFRRVSVKVKRARVTIRARPGYVAERQR